MRSALRRGQADDAWYPSGKGQVPPREVRWGGKVLSLRTGRRVLEQLPMSDVPLASCEGDHTPRVTWFDHLRALQGDAASWSWDELAAAVTDPLAWPASGKKGLPLWCFAELEDDHRGRRMLEPSADGRERDRAPACARLHALVLDYDDEPAWSLQQVRTWWGEVRYVAHTSGSHLVDKDDQPALPRGRVIVALSRPVTPDEYADLAEWAIHCGRGQIGEREIRSTHRAYFVPSPGPGGYEWDANLVPRALDVDAMLERLRGLEADVTQAAHDDGPDPTVWEGLDFSREGRPRPHVTNLVAILEGDPRWAGRLGWCDFSTRPLLDGDPMLEHELGEVMVWLGQRYQLHTTEGPLARALGTVCHRHANHPVRDYLDALVWDGTERIRWWLHWWMGCQADDLTQAFGMRWLISAVARIYAPGCKVDTMLVLQGRQGAGKSSALQALAGAPWFCDTKLPLGSADPRAAMMNVHGVWIYEIGELASFKRSDVETVKAFVSSPSDRFRAPFDRLVSDWPRQVVFAGSTNRAQFLNDSTGSRRFWVRTVGDIAVGRIAENRDQLWAEAVAAYREGEPWWLNDDEERLREGDAQAFEQGDPWEDAVADFLIGRDGVTCAEVLDRALEIRAGRATKTDEMRLADLLSGWGWTKRRGREGGRRAVRWWKPKAEVPS